MPAKKMTPASDGFAMPAEWAQHSTCYLSWPCKEVTWRGHFEEAKAAYKGVINAINGFEPVTVLATKATENEAIRALGKDIDIVRMELDDSWIRDNGPIFVRNVDGKVALVKFGFNAWGNKFPPYDRDAAVPDNLAKVLEMRLYAAPMVLEGGSISVDGEGTLITTEQCLLNRNRNPSMTQEQIESTLADYLGVKKVVWLGKGVEGDVTDGHVDGVAAYAGPHLVVAAHTKDRSDPNFERLEENIDRLESATDAKGRSIEVVKMIQPMPREVEGLHINPGYTNHYIANEGVVVPNYGIPEDTVALDILRSVHPGRKVLGVNCAYIEVGGGAVHCITQQRPEGRPMPSAD